MENTNIVPLYKKSNKQILKIQRLFSIHPVCVKLFEKLSLNQIFKFFTDNDLNSSNHFSNQSDLRDSSINKHLSKTQENFSNKFFDCSYEAGGIFLHDVMLNLGKKCVSGNLRKILQDFLDNQKQIVLLNEKVSPWGNVMAEALQSLIVSPLFFLALMIY